MRPARRCTADGLPAPPRARAGAGAPPAWLDRIDEIAPVVLVLGGFLMSPPFYGPMRRRLLARGAAAVHDDGVWTPDWVAAAPLGLDRIMQRARRRLRRAALASITGARSGGAPVLLVGHSTGGIVARAILAEPPVGVRRFGPGGAVGALVTIGTPHGIDPRGRVGWSMVARAAAVVDRVAPGAHLAPHVGYVSVASRGTVGRRDGSGRERIAHALYRTFLPGLATGEIEGDGVVPVASALLTGSRTIVLDGITHGQGGGIPWYGTDAALDAWWPVALDTWRDALRARSETLRT